MTHDAKTKSRTAFDRQAPLYDSTRFGQHARWLASDVLAEVERRRPDSLLDVGCGTGALLESVLAMRPGIRLTGIDLSSQMVARARQRLGERADIKVADAEALPLPHGGVDIVVCVDSLHHYPHPDVALAEIARVLRPAGALILAEWRVPALFRGLMNSMMHRLPEGDVRIYSRRELCDLARAAGFGELRWSKAGRRGQLLVGTR